MITATDVSGFMGRRRSQRGFDWTDGLAYAYLAIGVLIVLLPIFWMFMSSIKSPRSSAGAMLGVGWLWSQSLRRRSIKS